MTTTLRHAWITPPPTLPRRVYAITPKGRGYVWEGTPFAQQYERNRIAVCFDDGEPATYYTADEVEIERNSYVQSSARCSVTR